MPSCGEFFEPIGLVFAPCLPRVTDQFFSTDKIKKRGQTLIRKRRAFIGRRTRKRESQFLENSRVEKSSPSAQVGRVF